MATRFYLPSTGAASISPAFGSAWAAQDGSHFAADRITMVTTRISSAFAIIAGVANTNIDIQLLRQYISDELAAQTTPANVTIKGQMRCQSESAGAFMLACRVAKCDSAGSSVVELAALFFSDDLGQPPLTTTTLTNRQLRDVTEDITISLNGGSAITFAAGDRLIVELGYQDQTANTSRRMQVDWGDNSGTDLAEDDTTTAQNNPWVEISEDLTFGGGGGGGDFLLVAN